MVFWPPSGPAIAGRGLFASTDLPAGTLVSRLGGRLVDTATMRASLAADTTYVDTVVVGEDLHLLVILTIPIINK